MNLVEVDSADFGPRVPGSWRCPTGRRDGARSDGPPTALVGQAEAPRGLPSSLPSWPKYEKPGEVPSGFAQRAAEAGLATISEDTTADAAPKTIFFSFVCGSPLS